MSKLDSFDNNKTKCKNCKKYFDKEKFKYFALCVNCWDSFVRNPSTFLQNYYDEKQKI